MSYDLHLNHLYTNDLTVGELLFPKTDGTPGQVLQTDGAGQLMLASVAGDMMGPVSSINNALSVFNGVTGKLLRNSLGTLDETGKLTVPSLDAGGLSYPTMDGFAGDALVTDGSGNLSFSPAASNKSCAYGRVSAQYNVDIDAGDHVKYDTVDYVTGSEISLDSSTLYTKNDNVDSLGRVTLSESKSYLLEAMIEGYELDLHDGTFALAWYNADTGTVIGSQTVVYGIGVSETPLYSFPYVRSVFSPTVNTRVELRIVMETKLKTLLKASFSIKVL